jgi:ketosteroid isomerase-like protein
VSQENVELVREFVGLFAAGDRRSWRQHFVPDAVWDTSQSQLPAAGVYRGHEGIEQFFAEWLAIWDDYAMENDEFIDAGDSVVVVFRQRGRGKGSGAHAERTFFGVYDLDAGKVTRYRQYESREAALEAVELSE